MTNLIHTTKQTNVGRFVKEDNTNTKTIALAFAALKNGQQNRPASVTEEYWCMAKKARNDAASMRAGKDYKILSTGKGVGLDPNGNQNSYYHLWLEWIVYNVRCLLPAYLVSS